MDEKCKICEGSGVVDSGGVSPWGSPLDKVCDYCMGTGMENDDNGERVICFVCGGDGWYAGHSTDCTDSKCGSNCPVQTQCGNCEGNGYI